MKEVIVGDIHGDFKVWRAILQHSGCIDEQGMWIGVGIRLIQLGDIFDLGGRGVPYTDEDSEWSILWDIIQYTKIAPEYQSEVHFILGNHEWMNMNGDFYFVSPKAMKQSFYHYKKWIKRFPQFKTSIYTEHDARLAIVGKGKPIAILLANFGTAMLKIQNRLYVHGGILPEHAKLCTDIDHINQLLHDDIKDHVPYASMREFDKRIFKTYFKQANAIWYTRLLASEQLPLEDVQWTLKQFGVDKVFVGHTPQFQQGIRSIYQEQVYLCDSGMYEAYGRKAGSEVQYGIFDEETQTFTKVAIENV
jgi:Calcineurin-like phosphoesterase